MFNLITSPCRKYIRSYTNLMDAAMLALLTVATGCRFSLALQNYTEQGVYREYNITNVTMPESLYLDENSQALVNRRIVYTVHIYSAGALCALVNLFYSCALFVPGIGPLLHTIRRMIIRDFSRISGMIGFFTVGFLFPLYSMAICYRKVYSPLVEVGL